MGGSGGNPVGSIESIRERERKRERFKLFYSTTDPHIPTKNQ